MYLLGIQREAPRELIDPLLDEMQGRGEATVVGLEDDGTDPTRGDVRARYDETGWTLSTPGSVTSLLDTLAARCDYAMVEGLSDDRWAQLQLNGDSATGDLLDEPVPLAAVNPALVVDRLEETEPWESLESLVTAVKDVAENDRAGAIATFTGRVRARDSPDDTPTTHLEFDAYGEVAWETMDEIAGEITDRDGVYDVRMHHRTGVIEDGEDIVFVVVLAGHRDEAFTAVEDGINRLKAEVPIFKKEVTVDEEFWVHTRP